MTFIKNLLLAVILSVSMPMLAMSAETKEEKIEITDLPAVVSDGFKAAVPETEIKSVKKLTGNSTRYQIKYKSADGKDHQITIGEDGKPTRKVKAEEEAK